VDPHLLRTFVAVAECGSFSAAAARLGYTQSAVSQHIAALEHDLGTPLLHRRPVVPTPSGERLLEHAGPILLRLDAARADVRRTIADPPGALRTTAVAHEPLVLALPKDHPLARRRGLALHDLANARWIDAPDLAAPLSTLRTAAGSDAFRPALTYTGTDLHSLLTLVAAGHGLAVLPQSAASAGIAAVPVTTPRLVHRIELLHGHLTEPAATALASVLSGESDDE